MTPADPLHASEEVSLGADRVTIFRPERVAGIDAQKLARRPRTVRVILENVVRHFDPARGSVAELVALAHGTPLPDTSEFAYYPERILLQDFTGVPVLVDLSVLRSAAVARGLPADRVNPEIPVDLIVDHSVQVDSFGSARSLGINLDREYERNHERYRFLRWAKGAYRGVRIVPPGNGICHQVNLEYLADVVTVRARDGGTVAFPDTLIGTDSHTTMVNGVSVLGWGVGGIEAEAVMLGEPYFLPAPFVVGVELTGALPQGATATDLVLTVTKKLRETGVVDRFVEFFGPGVDALSVPDRATISNMCPEYGATAAYFPIDAATIAYLKGTGRDPAVVARAEAYARSQGLWGSPAPGSIDYDAHVRIDLGAIVPTVAGPRNPDESVPLGDAPLSFRKAVETYRSTHPAKAGPATPPTPAIDDGAVVIAAITSCTNTSNPSVLVGAGLLAKNANAKGLKVKPWVKTSLAPGSQVVTDYLNASGLSGELDRLGYNLVGYGCTTCIGNSGPLPEPVAEAIDEGDLVCAAVLSGNRNFEGRVNPQTRANYLASPPLVVAYALAGSMKVDLTHDPLGEGKDGKPVYLKDIWPSNQDIRSTIEKVLTAEMFRKRYANVFEGPAEWRAIKVSGGMTYKWNASSTYVQNPPYFEGMGLEPKATFEDIMGARPLALLGDSVTTDHISPAGNIKKESPAGEYLIGFQVRPTEFNSYGARRGNHEVMMRGTFANIRIKNEMVPGIEGGITKFVPSGKAMPIYDAAMGYVKDKTPLIVIAGKEYGTGSSRDWAAKGTVLLGVKAVVVESFERIHRSNLVGMGVLPLQFEEGTTRKTLKLDGSETYDVLGLADGIKPHKKMTLVVHRQNGQSEKVPVICRIDTLEEVEYYRNGGILHFVLRQLAKAK